jgi:hypothetical protein
MTFVHGSEQARKSFFARLPIIEKVKRKNRRWFNRHKHEDYFMDDEEYRWHQLYEANKEACDRFAESMCKVFAAMPTADELANRFNVRGR